MKILITGGHLAPALTVIEAWQEKYDLKDIIFVGRKYINDFEDILSFEYKEILKKNIKFISLRAGRLTRVLTLRTFLNLLLIPAGFFQAWRIINRERPSVILSFGGYLALPIALAGFLAGIPIYTHEQTINPGLTNRIIGFFAKKIFIAFEGTKKYFPKDKTITTGNPIRKSVLTYLKRPSSIAHIKKNRPIIYVTGGSLGSHSINVHIKNILPRLLENYIVIHQIGDSRQYHDFEDLKKFQSKNYFPVKHFYDEELGYIFDICDLVVSRAGANTFFELLALKKPTIFIPLPWAAGGEQELQAKIFVEAKVGEIFYQGQDSSRLLQLIDTMVIHKDKYQKNFVQLSHLYKKDASKFIIDEILSER